jgi:uncharacterized protein (TIGR03435 family)
VASVKSSPPGAAGGRGEGMNRQSINAEPGSLTMRNVSMSSAIRWAYDVPEFQISGPGWINTERYNIVAKSADAAPEDQLRVMLRTLLADRFKLAVHHEDKVMSYYVLGIAKSGLKFKPSESDGEMKMDIGRGNGQAVLQRVPISQVVNMLQTIMRAPVRDETGLKGKFDGTFNIATLVSTPIQNDDIAGTVVTALQDLAGLKLDPKKGPLDILVVDHAEKVPTEN